MQFLSTLGTRCTTRSTTTQDSVWPSHMRLQELDTKIDELWVGFTGKYEATKCIADGMFKIVCSRQEDIYAHCRYQLDKLDAFSC